MLKYNVKRATDAVQYLVSYRYAVAKVKRLRAYVTRPRALPFEGEEDVLNELLLIGRQDMHAMENLIALAMFKRPTNNEYQAAYMATTRRRAKLVVTIEEMKTGRSISVDEANQLCLDMADKWQQEQDVHVANCIKEYIKTHDKEPGWEQKNAFKRDFWETKDMHLSLMRDEAERIMLQREANKKLLRVVKKEVDPLIERKLIQDGLDEITNRNKPKRT